MKKLRNQRRVAVIAQAPRVDARRHEVMSQGVHLHDRRITRSITIIVGVRPFGQGRTGGRLDGNAAQICRPLVSRRLVGKKGEGNTAKAGATTARTKDHVRIEANLVELFLGFEANHGLMQQHMVEDRTQGVTGIRVGCCLFNSLGNCQTKRALTIRISGQRSAARVGQIGRRGKDFRPPGLHHRATERLLLITDINHENPHRQTKHLAGVGNG